MESWLRSYQPEELFDRGRQAPIPDLQALAPEGDRRMGANPHANGGKLLRDLRSCRTSASTRVDVPAPGAVEAQDMLVLGAYVRDVIKLKTSLPRTSASLALTRANPTA